MSFLDNIRWLVDEAIDTIRRNSVKGTGSGHWYPAPTTATALKVSPERCFYCGRFDPSQTVHTRPPCPGKKR